MRADVAISMSKSARAFHDIVWPVCAEVLGGGELIPVESVTATDFARDLDVYAGVDAWQQVQDKGLRPIGSRVQAGWDRVWNTFTIRYQLASGGRTEIDKRIDAIREGYLYPAVTVHAYLDAEDALQSVGVIDTVTLIRFAAAWRDEHGADDDLWKTRDGAYVKDVTGGNRMLVVPFATLPTTLVYSMEGHTP